MLPTLTKQTRQFIWVMRIFILIYALGGLAFFFKSEAIIYLINVGPKVFGTFEELPLSSERFWVVLATSMMAMLCLTSFYSSVYPNVKSYVVIHLVAKIVSITGFLILFFDQNKFFAYLFGALTDSFVVLVVAVFFVRSLSSRETGESSATR